ncbi:UNKNOWN [Stylonychia lemnae]|uniref:Uncharacterized protein n=1 Tax=Stylonychia lemnae TaxID=5949 RepID=A0A078BBH0_STYLE|nr:UNKNOWN [Stylonychia lemnae]|eukprot:CDW91561.1 UNKNOWN [Stylonychia lemnae]
MESMFKKGDIDPSGLFKYIQIQITDKRTGETTFLVRGYKSCPYHMNIFDKFTKEEFNLIENKEYYDASCPGGGRINHDSDNKKIFIYGYSQSYGQPDHTVAQEVLQSMYNDYEITWSNEGY